MKLQRQEFVVVTVLLAVQAASPFSPTRDIACRGIRPYRHTTTTTTTSLQETGPLDEPGGDSDDGRGGDSDGGRMRRRSSGPRRGPKSASNKQATATRRRRPARPDPSKYPVATQRAPHQHDHTQADARPFVDAVALLKTQDPNADASVFDCSEDPLVQTVAGPAILHEHVQVLSLDEVFEIVGLSQQFSSNKTFRDGIRNAMRQDIFDATPTYAGLSEKARRMLLLPDSSLQGSWKCQGRRQRPESTQEVEGREEGGSEVSALRMPALTAHLKEYLGETAPTGDEFMDTIGALCGTQPKTHWIDIVGISDRQINHSWHQDTGRSSSTNNLDVETMTVLLGFPAEDDYVGVGVFSHTVKLSNEQWAPDDHPANEPVLFPRKSIIDEKYICRPQFAQGKEIIVYRDVDVLHSAPDVAYRSSVMRFM